MGGLSIWIFHYKNARKRPCPDSGLLRQSSSLQGIQLPLGASTSTFFTKEHTIVFPANTTNTKKLWLDWKSEGFHGYSVPKTFNIHIQAARGAHLFLFAPAAVPAWMKLSCTDSCDGCETTRVASEAINGDYK